MSQTLFRRSWRYVFGVLLASIAVGYFSPTIGLAQPAVGPSGAVSAPRGAVEALPGVPAFPPDSIGNPLEVHMDLMAPVPPDELAMLRGDLLTLVNLLGTMDVRVAEHAVETGFTADKVTAMSDEELTTIYNAMPDPPRFHTAVNALVDLLLHPTVPAQKALNGAAVKPRRSFLPGMAAGTMAVASSLPYDSPLPEPIASRGLHPIADCPPNGYTDSATGFALQFVYNSLTIAATALDIACQVYFSVPCPVGSGGKFPPTCIAFGIAAVAQISFGFAIDLLNLCDINTDNRTNEANWANSKAIHNNLDAHHMDMMTILAEFRELSIRVKIENNLLMGGDLRISMFQLPEGPHSLISIQRTREIVLDTIQQNQLAGMPIGNAQAEFDAGESLLALNKYKDAYARYRNAYRAAVGQTIR